MIAYDTFEAALLAWLPAGSGVPKAYWQNRARPNERKFRSTGRLNVIAEQRLGVDDRRYDFLPGKPAGSDMEATIAGQRIITVSVLVKSRIQKPLETARYYLAKAATSLRMPSVLELLAESDIAVVDIGNTVNLDRPEQDRQISVGSMDVRFATVANEVDPVRVSYIQFLKLTSDFKDCIGNSLPPSLQLDDVTTP